MTEGPGTREKFFSRFKGHDYALLAWLLLVDPLTWLLSLSFPHLTTWTNSYGSLRINHAFGMFMFVSFILYLACVAVANFVYREHAWNLFSTCFAVVIGGIMTLAIYTGSHNADAVMNTQLYPWLVLVVCPALIALTRLAAYFLARRGMVPSGRVPLILLNGFRLLCSIPFLVGSAEVMTAIARWYLAFMLDPKTALHPVLALLLFLMMSALIFFMGIVLMRSALDDEETSDHRSWLWRYLLFMAGVVMNIVITRLLGFPDMTSQSVLFFNIQIFS